MQARKGDKMGKQIIRVSLCLMLIILAAGAVPGYHKFAQQVLKLSGQDVLLIDAGHGGMDGGAESSRGVAEKEINLAIAGELKQLAEANGWRTVMTREDDGGLYTDRGGTIRSMKTEDMKARRQMIEEIRPDIAVSIHLNSFREDPSVRGAQVFYPDMGGTPQVLEDSKKMAQQIQVNLIRALDDGKQRSILPKHDVYLMKQVFSPIVLIECGFLSNSQDAENLQKSAYQRKIAGAIMDGIMKFTGKTPPKSIPAVDSRAETREN